MPWGAKKKSTETKTSEVSASLCCAISLTYSSIQKLESPVEPKANEVRWSIHILRSLSDVYMDSEIARRLTERRSNKIRLRYNHSERGFNHGSICSFSGPSSVPGRGHWNCTEDYSSMRGWLNSAFEDCKTIDRISIRKHRMLNKRSESCKLRSEMS